MSELGFFLKNNTVSIELAEKHLLAVVAAPTVIVALVAKHIVMFGYKWASGFTEKYMIYWLKKKFLIGG